MRPYAREVRLGRRDGRHHLIGVRALVVVNINRGGNIVIGLTRSDLAVRERSSGYQEEFTSVYGPPDVDPLSTLYPAISDEVLAVQLNET